MGYARIEGALTAKEVHTIFKIHEINGSRRVPATTTDLLTVGERTYAYSTTMFRMENLIAMGYVRSEIATKRRFYYLTEKGMDLVKGGKVEVVGLGEVR